VSTHRFQAAIRGKTVRFYAGEMRSSGRIGWGYQWRIGDGEWQAMKPLDTNIAPVDSNRATIREAVLRDYSARYGGVSRPT
jgi:hypothetical protein